MSGQASSRGYIVRSALAILSGAVLLAGLIAALLIKTSEVVRPDCIVGVREWDCGSFTDYHMGVRWVIIGLALALACGLLLARRTIKAQAESN